MCKSFLRVEKLLPTRANRVPYRDSESQVRRVVLVVGKTTSRAAAQQLFETSPGRDGTRVANDVEVDLFETTISQHLHTDLQILRNNRLFFASYPQEFPQARCSPQNCWVSHIVVTCQSCLSRRCRRRQRGWDLVHRL